jgi:hypothetical protein
MIGSNLVIDIPCNFFMWEGGCGIVLVKKQMCTNAFMFWSTLKIKGGGHLSTYMSGQCLRGGYVCQVFN